MTAEELAAKTSKITGTIEERPPGAIGHHILLGGLECSRMMMKSALVLWCTAVGNKELQKSCYDDARRFVLNGGHEAEAELTAMDDRYIKEHSKLAEVFGPLFNYIAVASDPAGRVRAYFGLHGLYALCLTLAPLGGIAERKAVLASNPLDPVHWSDDVEHHMTINVAWMDKSHWSASSVVYREKLHKMAVFHQQFTRERMIRITLEDRRAEVSQDKIELSTPEGMKFIGEVSHDIAHNMFGLARSKPFTIRSTQDRAA